jgi:hypothetical protein
MTETDISRAIREAVNRLPQTMVVRVQAGGYRQRSRGAEPGTADLLGVCRGRPLALEVKRPGGVWAKNQQAWCDRWRAAGGWYFVVTSVEDAIKWVREAAGA